MPVELIQHCGNDKSVVRAARISTGKDYAPGSQDDPHVITPADLGLINFLMANRHGTPFEHNSMTFRIEAPIFVWREFMRHRIGFSYNEMSGRYVELPPTFYIPAADRNLVQQGKPGAYTFVPGDALQVARTQVTLECAATDAYDQYQFLLSQGIAREVARMCLPVNIYSAAWVTCNARSLMSFLSLRTKSEIAKFPSFPQREIEIVAEQMEMLWSEIMPGTWDSYNNNGRVSP